MKLARAVYMYFQKLRKAVSSGAANFASCSDHAVPDCLSTFVNCGMHKRPIANPHCIINGGGISVLQAGEDTSSYSTHCFAAAMGIEPTAIARMNAQGPDVGDCNEETVNSIMEEASEAQLAEAAKDEAAEAKDAAAAGWKSNPGQKRKEIFTVSEDDFADEFRSDDSASDGDALDADADDADDAGGHRPGGDKKMPAGSGRRLGGGKARVKNRSSKGRKPTAQKVAEMQDDIKSEIEGLAQGLKGTGTDPSLAIAVGSLSIAIESEGAKNRAFDERESQKDRDFMLALFGQK